MENIIEGTFGREPDAWSGQVKQKYVHCQKCGQPCRMLGGDIELSECCGARIEMRETNG